MLEEVAVPNIAVSGLLEAPTAGAVVKGALGSVKEYTMTGEPPELEVSAFDEVKDGRSKLHEGCVKGCRIDEGKLEKTVSSPEVEGISGLLFGGATHLVQIVEVDVRVTVEILVVTFSIAELPDVTVLVTGQVVKDV